MKQALTLMKGDEVVEALEEGANRTLLSTVQGQRDPGLEEVSWRDVKQTMVPGTLSGNRLHTLVPPIRLVVRYEVGRVYSESFKHDVEGRHAALLIPLESLDRAPRTVRRRALVVGELAFPHQIVRAQILTRHPIVEELGLVNKAVLGGYRQRQL